jgi:hypothetical protein
MTTRVLPAAEWDRLEGTELDGLADRLSGDRAVVIVVEDSDGRIVGCWAAIWALHIEGLWVAPDHRGKAAVLRRLVHSLNTETAQAGISAVVAGVRDERMRDIASTALGKPLPGQLVVIPVPVKP